MFSRFFILRPIFATVISLIIVLAGIMSIKGLPVAQFPEILPPQVEVTATYTGATAEVIAATVAAPLEQEINGVEDMIYMNSVSSGPAGSLTIVVSFEIGTDPDMATINVNNAVQAALTSLPTEVCNYGVTVEKKSSSMLQVLAMASPDGRYDTIYLSNYALINVIDELKRLEGVGDAMLFAPQDYAMRIWLRPDIMAQLGVTPMEVAAAIQEQNLQFAPGRIGQYPLTEAVDMTFTVATKGRLSDPEEFREIILRVNDDGSTLKLGDVARVELGAKDYNFSGKLNGQPIVPIGIYLSPGANALDTAELVSETLERMKQNFPEGVDYEIPYDTTDFVRVSIEEVIHTLFEAMVLVFLVIYLFLQNWRATIIPCLAVPVSIIGTFAGMYVLGFTINTLTLFGLVLAIGLVVDDAIVVLENVERIMAEEHLPVEEATIKATAEVTSPIIATVLVLCAVFVPVAFTGGMAGEMYKQFAITIAVSMAISGFVALTLSPALCRLLLKPHHNDKPMFLFRWFNTFFDAVTTGYTAGVKFFIKRSLVGLAIFGVLCFGTWDLFQKIPTGLVPNEDQGAVFGLTFLPDATSLDRTTEVMDRFNEMVTNDPSVKMSLAFAGFDLITGTSKSNAGTVFITLHPWDQRKTPDLAADALIGKIFGSSNNYPEGVVLAFSPPPIMGMSTTGGFEGYIQNRGGASSQELAAAMSKVVAAANQRPELTGVTTTFAASVPQLYVEVDRNKAKVLGVAISDLFVTMQAMFGTYYVNDFNMLGRTFMVLMMAEAEYRDRADDLTNIHVQSNKGEMIPLSSLVTINRTLGPEVVERFNIFPAAKIIGGPAPGYSSGQALLAIQEVVNTELSTDYTLGWTGSSYQEQLTGDTTTVVFALGLLMVFLILAAQYERWSLPLAVIMIVPFAIFGAMAATYMRGLSNDVYLQVSLVTLIGLSAKNAILIVEFAMQQIHEGKGIVEGVVEAARLRCRPIVMTSMAFILGVVPMAISTGAGSASRHALGTGIIGGMLVATFVATFFIPMFFCLIMRMSTMFSGSSKEHKGSEEV
ncbi:MAG: efflux RND transporter permease subunit [Pseudomonadota bacterium]